MLAIIKRMNPLIPPEIREQHGYYVGLTVITVLKHIDCIPNLVKQYDKLIGDPVEFIIFTEGLKEHVIVSHLRMACKHRIFVRNYDDYTDKSREYISNFGGGYLTLIMEEDEEIDKKNLDDLLSAMILNDRPSYYKDGVLKAVYKGVKSQSVGTLLDVPSQIIDEIV